MNWDQPGIPHKGWQHDGVEDLGYGNHSTCMMCGNEQVRYLHHLTHQGFEGEMMVGCLCAAKMTEDYLGTKKQERLMRNKASKRTRWLTRNWRRSSKGNEYLNVERQNVGVFQVHQGWKYWVNNRISDEAFNSSDEAKLKLFDYVYSTKGSPATR